MYRKRIKYIGIELVRSSNKSTNISLRSLYLLKRKLRKHLKTSATISRLRKERQIMTNN